LAIGCWDGGQGDDPVTECQSINMLGWTECHPGLAAWVQALAAWVQAVGIIITFSAAIYFSRKEILRRRAAERRRAAALVPSLLPALDAFQRKISALKDNPQEAKTLELPNKVTRRARDFQLLEGAAGLLSLLQDQLADLNHAISEMQNLERSDQDQRTKSEDDVRYGLSECHRTLELMIEQIRAINS
jgi:hypothetical protein